MLKGTGWAEARRRLFTRGPQAIVLVSCLAILALIWSGVHGHLSDRREGILGDARRDASNLSLLLGEHVTRIFSGTDQILHLMQADYADDPATFDFQAWTKRADSLEHVALQISRFDASGNLVASKVAPLPGAPRTNVSDRAYFTHLAATPGAGVYVDRTMRGRLLNRWALQLARRLDAPGGSFAGVIVISLDPDYLADRFRDVDVGSNGSVSLIGTDGYVRARIPGIPGMYETEAARLMPQAALLARKVAESTSGSFTTDATHDGIPRVYGFRRLDGFPLAVSVGKSLEDPLNGYFGERDRAVAIALAASAAILFGMAFLLGELEVRRGREEELARAQEAIFRSEERHRLLADNASDMVVQLDLESRRLYVSPSSRHMLGRTPAEMLGIRPTEDVHPDDAARLGAMVAALASGEREADVSQHRMRHADGRWIWVEASWRLVRDAAGAPAGFVASVRDITDRLGAERALRDEESRYRALADALPQLVWAMDGPDGEASYVNRGYDLYFGPLGRHRDMGAARVHPDEADAYRALWHRAARTGERQEIEIRLRRHDNDYRWHALVAAPRRSGEGDAVSWLATALDIDESVRARKELEDATMLLRLAQEGSGAGAWDFNLVTGRIELSEASARIHAVPGDGPASLDEAGWRALVHPGDAEETLARLWRAAATHTTFEGEFRVPVAGGHRWVQGIGRTHYAPDGVPLRMVGLNFDVTHRKEALTALMEAKAEAERASAAKSDFLASMSHELRTPLNAVIGFTGLLSASERMPDDLRRHAELARTSGEALLSIVNDVLDLSKVEAGAIELDARPFALVPLVESCLGIVRGGTEASGLAISSSIDPALPGAVWGDEGRLRQILLNLLNNAVKFTPSGSVALSVGPCPSVPGRILFSVADTGIGIPEDRVHRIFQRFSQVDGSISRDFGGTGLGLAICRGLVEAMGGEIDFSSEHGRGSTFRFSVPLAPAAEDGPAPSAMPMTRTGRVLLVEDVPVNQELARIVLTGAGHAVDVASDGREALDMLRAGVHDLVLMDIQMPGMDGMEATRRLREMGGRLAGLPVIAMTANALAGEVARFREAGLDDHVAKPFQPRVLLAAVDRWLGAGGTASTAPPSGMALDQVVAMLGPSKSVLVLEALARQCGEAFAADPATPEGRDVLRAQAHALVSAAGMLGFGELSAACAVLDGFGEARIARDGLPVFRAVLERALRLRDATRVEALRVASALGDGPRLALA